VSLDPTTEYRHGLTIKIMPTLYYRMASEQALAAARERLRQERFWSPSRALGDENRLIVRVDYLPGHPPDDIIREVDHLAHRVPTPLAEQNTANNVRESGPNRQQSA
jgi:hypothetical protein